MTWSSLEQSVGTRRKVLLASHEGAIAAVNAGPGSIGNVLYLLCTKIGLYFSMASKS